MFQYKGTHALSTLFQYVHHFAIMLVMLQLL